MRLYSPACTTAMYPHAEGMHTNSGRVDVDAPDLERFPLFAAARFQGGASRAFFWLAGCLRRWACWACLAMLCRSHHPARLPAADCVLEAGQMLYIPRGWWHYVKSTTVSFSVSYWWK